MTLPANGTNGHNYRLAELERRMARVEDKTDGINALTVELREARNDISQLSMRFARMTWLLVTTIASVAAGIVIVVISIAGGH